MLYISIHALREEGDARWHIPPAPLRIFLSTPSARRATGQCMRHRSACRISIHALREEGDAWTALTLRPNRVFLSTPSARRATLPISA